MTRRQAIKTTALAGAALATLPAAIAQNREFFSRTGSGQTLISTATRPATLPPLPYAYNALAPHIDERTMEIHHDQLHQSYVDNLNQALAKFDWRAFDSSKEGWLTNMLKNLSSVPEDVRTAVRNYGGGHYNHSLFWQVMTPNGGGKPAGDLGKAITASFGSFSAFQQDFAQAAMGQFGSGWAWLILDGKQLSIMATPNQDTPLGSSKVPLLGIDVWEHAYYLNYQNRRADYISEWFKVVNWDFVSQRYAKMAV